MILFFWLQVAISTYKGSSVCMGDCTSLLTPRPPSLYEQYCCIPSNSGKQFKTRKSNIVRIVLCPNHLPFSCQKFPLNCSEVYKCYYTIQIIQVPNGSLISVYYDIEGSNCDGNRGWMRVGYLNMSDPGATCPPGITLRQFNNKGLWALLFSLFGYTDCNCKLMFVKLVNIILFSLLMYYYLCSYITTIHNTLVMKWYNIYFMYVV